MSLNMYQLNEIKTLTDDYESKLIEHFQQFFKTLINEESKNLNLEDIKLQFKQLQSFDNIDEIFTNEGFYIIISDYKISQNQCTFQIAHKGIDLKALYRGETSHRRQRIIGHLFKRKYKGKDKTFMKVGNRNGINIDRAPYKSYNWFVFTCSMSGSNQQIRMCMEKAFDSLYNKPLFSAR